MIAWPIGKDIRKRIGCSDGAVIEENGEGEPNLLGPSLSRLLRFFDVDDDDLHAARSVFLIQGFEMRSLRIAERSPRSSEVHHDDVAVKIGKRNRATAEIMECERRSIVSVACRGDCQRGNASNECERDDGCGASHER